MAMRSVHQHREHMDEDENARSLIPLPDGSLANTATGTQRILSMMIEEALALVKDAAVDLVDLDALVRDGETLYFCSKGDGITEVTTRAFRLFLRAAEGGHSEAQNYLGFCYRDGYGVQQNYAEAVRWWRMAAEQGNAMAQNNLATCYYSGNETGSNQAA